MINDFKFNYKQSSQFVNVVFSYKQTRLYVAKGILIYKHMCPISPSQLLPNVQIFNLPLGVSTVKKAFSLAKLLSLLSLNPAPI